jgi:hypothetical protein
MDLKAQAAALKRQLAFYKNISALNAYDAGKLKAFRESIRLELKTLQNEIKNNKGQSCCRAVAARLYSDAAFLALHSQCDRCATAGRVGRPCGLPPAGPSPDDPLPPAAAPGVPAADAVAG